MPRKGYKQSPEHTAKIRRTNLTTNLLGTFHKLIRDVGLNDVSAAGREYINDLAEDIADLHFTWPLSHEDKLQVISLLEQQLRIELETADALAF